MLIDVKKGHIPYHVAIAVQGHKLICWSTNDVYDHAEVATIKKLEKLNIKHKIKWEKITIIVVRTIVDENNELQYKMSKPCKNCCQYLKNTNIKNISWSNDEGYFDTCKVCDFETEQISRRFRPWNINL